MRPFQLHLLLLPYTLRSRRRFAHEFSASGGGSGSGGGIGLGGVRGRVGGRE